MFEFEEPQPVEINEEAPVAAPVSWPWRLLVVALALGGGVLGILGAAIQEFGSSTLLVPFFAGPMIEEAMKPAGLYIVMGRWPRLLPGRFFTALLSALGGLVFAVAENLIYLYVYFPEHSPEMALYRNTVCVAVHVVCSFIVGLGITPRLAASVRGEIPFLSVGKRYFFTGMALHSAYNIGIFVAGMIVPLPFE